MARTPESPVSSSAKQPRGLRNGASSAPRAAGTAAGGPATPDDLVDVEAPPQGGEKVDTAAYAASTGDGGRAAIANDLVDVEAPPAGGGAVDTAAYAAAGLKPRRGGRRPAGAASRVDAQAPPPPPSALPDADGPDVDPLAGDAGGAPPRAGPDLGGRPDGAAVGDLGGGAPAVVEPDAGDLLRRAGLAALRLAAERPWPQVSLRDVAQEAGVPFAALYAEAPSKPALLLALSARLDRAALERIDGDAQPGARDRLFEAFMSRLEVMEPHRDALLAIARSERMSPALAPALPRTVRALLEGAGVDTAGGRGALRQAAVLGVWARTLQVWRDDEGALNRTMAEIDKLLARADKRLSRVAAGF